MSRVWPGSEEGAPWDDRDRAALPAAVAAVPLLAAVTVAAGLLPWGLRAVLGVALVVVGLHLRRLAGRSSGDAAGRAIAHVVWVVTTGTGVVLVAVAVAVGLDGGHLKPGELPAEFGSSSYAGVFSGPIGGLPGPALGLALLVAGILVVRGGERARARGDACTTDGASSPEGPDRSWGTAAGAGVVGAGGASLLFAASGPGTVDVSSGLRSVMLLVIAAAVVAAVLRGGTGTWARGATFGAGLLVALVVGDGTSLVEAAGGLFAEASPTVGTSGVGRGVAAVLSSATAAALLAVAVRRRDALIGLLPLGVLMTTPPVRGVPAGAGVLLLPVVAGVAALASSVGRGPLAGRTGPTMARLVLVAALLAGVAAAQGLTSGARLVSFGEVGVIDVPELLAAVAGAVAVLATVVASVVVSRSGDSAATTTTTLAVLAIVGLYFLHPAWTLTREIHGAITGGRGFQSAALGLELAAAGAIVVLRRRPIVVAGGVLVLGDVLGHIGQLVLYGGVGSSPAPLTEVLVSLGPAALLLVGFAGVAALGPSRTVGTAQAGAIAAGAVLALAMAGATGTVASGRTNDEGDRVAAALGGGQLVVGTLVVVAILAGTAALAASVARRASGAASGLVVLLSVLAGLFATGVGVGGRRDAAGGGIGFPSPSDAVLGFRTSDAVLQDVAGWLPAALAALAVALVVAARRGVRRSAPAGDG